MKRALSLLLLSVCVLVVAGNSVFAESNDESVDHSLLFKKALALEDRPFRGSLVAGDKDCEPRLMVSPYDLWGSHGGLYYGFERKASFKQPFHHLNETPSLDSFSPSPFCVTPTKARNTYWLGTEESGWEGNVEYHHHRRRDSHGSVFYFNAKVRVSIDAGIVYVDELVRFRDVTGIWRHFFYPVVETQRKRTTLQRLENGDMEYEVSEKAVFTESENEGNGVIPAGEVKSSISCRYREEK